MSTSQDILLEIFDKVDIKTKINMMIAAGNHTSYRVQMQQRINQELLTILKSLNELITPCKNENGKIQYHYKHAVNGSGLPLYYVLSEENAENFDGIPEDKPEDGKSIDITADNMKQVLEDVKELANKMVGLLINTPSDQPDAVVQIQADKFRSLITEISNIQEIFPTTAKGGKKKRLDSLTVKELQAKVKSKGIQGYSKMNKAQLIGALRSRRST